MSRVFVAIHMAWATRWRLRLLAQDRDPRLALVLNEAARREDATLLAIGVAPDHVHVVARLAARGSVSSLAQRLKGLSSHEMNAHAACGGKLATSPNR